MIMKHFHDHAHAQDTVVNRLPFRLAPLHLAYRNLEQTTRAFMVLPVSTLFLQMSQPVAQINCILIIYCIAFCQAIKEG